MSKTTKTEEKKTTPTTETKKVWKDYRTAQQKEAVKVLRELGVRPGTTLYTTVTHVARSGMSRHIRVFVKGKRGSDPLREVSWQVGKAIKERVKDDGIVVGGCGMDMGFHVVYELGRVMFPKGGPLSKSGRRAQEERSGETRERDGGYLLRQRWL